MSPHRHREGDTVSAFPVGEDTRIKLSVKTLLLIIGGTAVAVSSWINVKMDLGSLHAENAQYAVQISEMRADVKDIKSSLQRIETRNRGLADVK